MNRVLAAVIALGVSAPVFGQDKKVYQLTPQQQAAIADVQKKREAAKAVYEREDKNYEDTIKSIYGHLGFVPKGVQLFVGAWGGYYRQKSDDCATSIEIVEGKYIVVTPDALMCNYYDGPYSGSKIGKLRPENGHGK